MTLMKVLLPALVLVSSFAEAQIYRCETPQGLVFSDMPCGEQAELVSIEEDSSGIAPGPQQETREYLAQKREERAEARKENAQLRATRPQTPVVVPEQQPVVYPAYWPAYRNPQRPIRRPGPGRPSRPIVDPDIGGTVIRRPDRGGN